MSGQLTQVRAIETRYNGYRFRSRLEARWAVFFDALGVPYEYEKEGFELGDNERYLPDFWLPEQDCWVEIKPNASYLIGGTYSQGAKVAKGTRKDLFVFEGGDFRPATNSGYSNFSMTGTNIRHFPGDTLNENDYEDWGVYKNWVECVLCFGCLHLVELGYNWADIRRDKPFVGIEGSIHWMEHLTNHPVLKGIPEDNKHYGSRTTIPIMAAYAAARQARFER